MTAIPKTGINANVTIDEESLQAEIDDTRPEARELFTTLPEAQRKQLAQDAWLIGLRALQNAHIKAEEARLGDVGAAVLDELDKQLKHHVSEHERTVVSVLERYFDPSDGRLSRRLDSLLADEGSLARLLARHVGPQHSTLAETLADAVGERSALIKRLSPTDAHGLVQTLQRGLRDIMEAGQRQIVDALDPLAENGAISRFLKSLRDEIRTADTDRANQLARAMAALDANDEDSLISRLARETAQARQTLLQAVNPETPGSPLATLKSTITQLLNDHGVSQNAFIEEQRERQSNLEREIRDALARLETRRGEEKRGPRGGLTFEDAVIDFASAALEGAPCTLDVTGTTTGLRPRCKKGDAVARFTAESAFAGSAVVFEAKQDASYTTEKALAELDEARANRGASAGVLVMASTHASSGFPRFSRFGQNVLVTWDESDPTTDPYFHAAICLGLALVARIGTAGDEGDIAALSDIESRVENEVDRLERIDRSNEQIRKHSSTIGEEVRRGKKKLDRLLRNAKETLEALDVQLVDERLERRSPISLPSTSLSRASKLLDVLPNGTTGTDAPSTKSESAEP